MSVTPSTHLESQLTTTWGAANTYPDVPMVMPAYTSWPWPRDSQPQFWTKYQVWEWLQQVMDMHQIDASCIPFQNFDMDGHQLCNLSYQDFVHAAGSVGPILFHSITELKWGGPYHVEIGQLELKPEFDFSCLFPDVSYPTGELYDPLAQPNGPVGSPTSSSPDVKRSLARRDQAKKHTPRGTHLWEFIRDILLNPETNPGLIKWEDRTEGVFRFLKSEAVAQLWGKKKNNSSMTYEKLSRAMRKQKRDAFWKNFGFSSGWEGGAIVNGDTSKISNLTYPSFSERYYYKREILERVDGRRLVYKFGKNARGWRESEK